jgi:hypothetical protein
MKRTISIVAGVAVAAAVVYVAAGALGGGDGPILVLKPKPRPAAPGAGAADSYVAWKYDWMINGKPATTGNPVQDDELCFMREDLIKPALQQFQCDGTAVTRVEFENETRLARITVERTALDRLSWTLHSRADVADDYLLVCSVLDKPKPIFKTKNLPEELLSYVYPGHVRCYASAGGYEPQKQVCINLDKDTSCPK